MYNAEIQGVRQRFDNKKLLLFPEFEFETHQHSNLWVTSGENCSWPLQTIDPKSAGAEADWGLRYRI
jgi:hypothetical protein